MYKLLIVDDEEIEREGMAQCIPWQEYGVNLIGAAWNGVQALEHIRTECPDIILTDIKMPIMDGIELIRRVRAEFPGVEFIVLSGYGEYEFTSQAMEEGVRHYVLKPCDEERIVEVLSKVMKELERKANLKKESDSYHATVRKLLPRAREQVFLKLLLGKEQLHEDYQLFLTEISSLETEVRVLSLRCQNNVDYLEQFVLENVLGELLGEGMILLSTTIHQEVLFLIKESAFNRLPKAVERAEIEFKRFAPYSLQAAVSEKGKVTDAYELYGQIQELFYVGAIEGETELLHLGLFRDRQSQISQLVNYRQIKEIEAYDELLFEIYLVLLKMEVKNFTARQKEEAIAWITKVLYGKNHSFPKFEAENDLNYAWVLVEEFMQVAEAEHSMALICGKEEERIKCILLAIYQYLREPEMNIRFLAKEVLFMNEEYFGRLFLKHQKVKFSTFLLEQRIRLAQRLMQYYPDIKISLLAEMVGYSPDGQYFSKAFRKVTGMTPSEYKSMLSESTEAASV